MKTEVVTTLKRQATKLLKELREKKEPILITEHGKPSAYLVDVDYFEIKVTSVSCRPVQVIFFLISWSPGCTNAKPLSKTQPNTYICNRII